MTRRVCIVGKRQCTVQSPGAHPTLQTASIAPVIVLLLLAGHDDNAAQDEDHQALRIHKSSVIACNTMQLRLILTFCWAQGLCILMQCYAAGAGCHLAGLAFERKGFLV